jgi:hypothetical protein
MRQRNASAWRTGPLFPPLSQTTQLDIYDLRQVTREQQLSIASLVGLVNRGPAKIYLLENEDDEFWLKQIASTLPCEHHPFASNDLLPHLLTIHRELLNGLVLYDPALPDTINVATTLASLRAGLVVSPEQASTLQAAPYTLPMLVDLREHGWKTRVQAYLWAYKHLLQQCSSELVAGMAPDMSACLRSFLITHRVFTCWLDPRKFTPSPAASWFSERRLQQRILAHFSPGAVHLGWFISEPAGIRLTSRAALLTLASDHCTNLTAWSSLPASSFPRQSRSTSSSAGPVSQKSAHQSLRADTTYLSFTISDGDNLQYCQHRLLHLWQDPARGQLPLGWTIAPALAQTMPYLAAFYRSTATAYDEFIAGPSGAAYLLPSDLPEVHRTAFLNLTAEYMQAMQLTFLQILDSSGLFSMKLRNVGLQETIAAQLVPHGLRGIFSGGGGSRPSWRGRAGVMVYQNLGLAFNPQRTLRLITRASERGTRFINVYIFAWSVTPGDLQTIVEKLGDGFEVVTPGQLLQLIEEKA